jgi:hypothetical protein
MVMDNKFKDFGKIIEKDHWPVIANRGTFCLFWEQGQLLIASIGWENTAEINLD